MLWSSIVVDWDPEGLNFEPWTFAKKLIISKTHLKFYKKKLSNEGDEVVILSKSKYLHNKVSEI